MKKKQAKKPRQVDYSDAKIKEILAFMRAGNSTTKVHRKFGMSSQWAGKLRRKHGIKPPGKKAKPDKVKKTKKAKKTKGSELI